MRSLLLSPLLQRNAAGLLGGLLLLPLMACTPAHTATTLPNCHTRYSACPAQDKDALGARIGALLMTGFTGTTPRDPGVRSVLAHLRCRRIGGVILSGANIRSPGQLRTLVAALRAAHPRALIAIDQEGGQVARLRVSQGFIGLPSPHTVATLPLPRVRALYDAQAQQLASLGIGINLAPVVDLAPLRAPSPAIAARGRAFSSDPERVRGLATIMIAAHRRRGIHTVLKHFPGHGHAPGDTHERISSLKKVPPAIRAAELSLFAQLTQPQMASAVMTAHLIDPVYDAQLPATLSHRVLTGLLRKRLGFMGPIITDDLMMAAILKNYTLPTILLHARRAGADLLLFTHANVNFLLPGCKIPFARLPQLHVALTKRLLSTRALSGAALKRSLKRVRALRP